MQSKINNETPDPLGLYVTTNTIITYTHITQCGFLKIKIVCKGKIQVNI